MTTVDSWTETSQAFKALKGAAFTIFVIFFLCQIEIEILLRFYVLNVDFLLSERALCAKYVKDFTTSAKHQT